MSNTIAIACREEQQINTRITEAGIPLRFGHRLFSLGMKGIQINKDPRNKTAGYSGDGLNLKSPFPKGETPNGYPIASYGE